MKTNWTELRVSDVDGDDAGSLGDIVENAPANLDDAVIVDGKISEWPNYLIAAPGEGPDWDTPRNPVDWNGFEDKLNAIRG